MPQGYRITITRIDDGVVREQFARKVMEDVRVQLKEKFGFMPGDEVPEDIRNTINYGHTYHTSEKPAIAETKIYEQVVMDLNIPFVIKSVIDSSGK
jgi:hypothetical protein